MNLLHLTPIYGWGWVDGVVEETIETTPPPFALTVEPDPDGDLFAQGWVDQPGHLLHGLWTTLIQRHTVWDGALNLTAHRNGPDSPAAYYGYVLLDEDAE